MPGDQLIEGEGEGHVKIHRSHGGFVKWRLVFAALGAIGMAIIYGLKVNLSVNIVAMLNHTSLDKAAELAHHAAVDSNDPHAVADAPEEGVVCYNVSNSKGDSSQDGPFEWTEPQQGLVLGSYFWGYFITQVPGGRLAELLGGKWVFFIAVLLNILSTLLSPVASYFGYEYLIILRILAGLGGGVTFPAMNVLISKWAPKEERSTISSIAYGGTSLGTVISLPTAGLIAGSLGWEAVFYIHGGLAVIWCILWVVFVTDSPDNHMFISDEEKDFISNSIQGTHSHVKKVIPPVPWKKIFLSHPFWAIIFSHTINNFGWYMFLVELPSFMSKGLGFKIEQNAGLSCLPFLCNWIFSIIYSNRLDWARNKNLISTTTARKLSMGIASFIPGVCLIGVCLSGCDRVAVVVLVIVAALFYGSMFSGVFSNHVDIASNYAGVLMGISNMCATIPGFLVPALVGHLTHGKNGIAPWHFIFYITAGLLLLELIVYSLMASGVEQEWNKIDDADDETKTDQEIEMQKKN